MAHPWIFESNFESGDETEWDTEVDGGSQLDFPHYSELARTPGLPMPFNGAYCARWQLISGLTAAATLSEADLNITDTSTAWAKWNLWIDPNFKTNITADDNFVIFEWQGAGNVVSFALGMDYTLTTDRLVWASGELTPTTVSAADVTLGKWLTVEIKGNAETGGGGEIEVYITPDGAEPSSTVTTETTSMTNIAVTHGVLGVQDKLGTTVGTMLMDNFVMDDLRIWPDKDRFSTTRQITKSQHLFVGPGSVDNVTVFDAGGDATATLEIFDTDTAQSHALRSKGYIQSEANEDAQDFSTVPFNVTRGCYVSLGGTTSKAWVSFTPGANWYSDGNIRRFAQRRNVGR